MMSIDDTGAGLSLAELKRTKNRVIGNPVAKEALVRDEGAMRRLVDCLDYAPSSTSTQERPTPQVRTEAAHIIGSLCHGSPTALLTLLRLHTLPILIRSLSLFTPPADPLTLRGAYARALKALVQALADVVGPSEYGLRPEVGGEVREAAREGLDLVFSLNTLDVLLPLLIPPIPSPSLSTSSSPSPSPSPSSSTLSPHPHLTHLTSPLTSLLASATRTPAHRAALTAWLPPAERAAVLERAGRSRKRGWEKVGVGVGMGSPVSPVGGGPAGSGFGRERTVSPGGSNPQGSTGSTLVMGSTSTPSHTPTHTPTPPGTWILRVVLALLAPAKDAKLQEACLGALAALVRDAPGVAGWVGRGWVVELHAPPLALIHALTKSRNTDVQLAACMCAVHVLRACASSGSGLSGSTPPAQGTFSLAQYFSYQPHGANSVGAMGASHFGAPTHVAGGYGVGSAGYSIGGHTASSFNVSAYNTSPYGVGVGAGPSGHTGGGTTNPFDYAQSVYAQSPLEDACVRAVVGCVRGVLGGCSSSSVTSGSSGSSSGSGASTAASTTRVNGGSGGQNGKNAMGGTEGGEERRVKACFVLYHLTTDDRALCQFAFERGCLDVLAETVKASTPREGSVDAGEGWDECESGGVGRVREAALTAIATLGLFNAKIRQAITDVHGLLPYVATALRQGVPSGSVVAGSSVVATRNGASNGSRIATHGVSTSNVNTPIPTRASTPTPGSVSRSRRVLPASSSSFSHSSSSSPPLGSGSSTSFSPDAGVCIEPISMSSAGVRYAACQCVRVLSRGVSVLRTNIIDSGLGMEVFRVVMRGWRGDGGGEASIGYEGGDEYAEGDESDGKGREGAGEERQGAGEEGGREYGDAEVEDRRVLNAALAAICNIVMEFSPLRPTFLQQGLMPRLVQLLGSSDASLRLNALWAIKNLLYRTSLESKKDMMRCLGWERLFDLLHDYDLAIQEQAYGVIRNISSDEEGLDMIFTEKRENELLESITEAISVDTMPSTPTSPSGSPSPSRVGLPRSPSTSRAGLSGSPSISRASSGAQPSGPSIHERTPTIIQALYALANLCNGSSALASSILARPILLANLRACLAECGSEVRKPAVDCLLKLAKEHPKKRRALVESGVIGTLRRLCEWVPPPTSSSSGGSGSSVPIVAAPSSLPVPGGGYGGVIYPHAYHHHHPSSAYVPMWSAPPSGSGTPANAGSGASGSGSRPGAVPMGRRASGGGTSPVRSLSYGASAGTYVVPPPMGVMGPGLGGVGGGPVVQGYHTYQRDGTAYVTAGASGGGVPGSSSSSTSSLGGGVSVHPAIAAQMHPAHAADLARYAAYPYTYSYHHHHAAHPHNRHHHPQLHHGVVPGMSLAPVPGCVPGVGMGAVGMGGGGGAVSAAMDMDKEVYDMARTALDWLEHGEAYGM